MSKNSSVPAQSDSTQSLIQPSADIQAARQILLDFFATGRAARRDQAIQFNTAFDRLHHGRQLAAAFRKLQVEGVIVESPKRLSTGKASPKNLFHLRSDLLSPEALERLQRLVVLPAPAATAEVRPKENAA